MQNQSELPVNWLEDFDLIGTEQLAGENELLAVLAQRIGEMLEGQPDYLMSLLYRLDVREEKLRPVMDPYAEEPVNFGLARLVLERQKQRAETKRSVKPEPLGDEWAF